MALARTSPDDAVSNLSKWAKRAGLHHIPGWLRNRRADEIAHFWAKRVFILLLTMDLGGIVFYFVRTGSPASSLPDHQSSLPPIPFADDEVHGWLRPANDPTPSNGCDRLPSNVLPADAMKVLIGDNAIAKSGLGKFIAVEIGTCEAISMERTSEGVFINAEVFDSDDNKPVQIRNNEIVALNGESFSARQSRDLSTITVKDRKQNVIFYARFINPTTVRVRGIFGCAGRKPIAVTDNSPIPGVMMSGNCFANSRVGIRVN